MRRDLDISFVMAARNAAPWIEVAIASALGQEDVVVEVVVVDDGSTDGTGEIVAELARRDERVRLIRGDGRGASAARNLALDAARGAWIGVLDADDLIEPARTSALIRLAETAGCRLVADACLRFLDEDPSVTWISLPEATAGGEPFRVELEAYLGRNRLTGGEANLGFLKPIVRRDFLTEHRIRYDERLRIGEDFDLVLRCLLAGSGFVVLPRPLYRYRVLARSLSRRLTRQDLATMLAAYDELRPTFPPAPGIAAADRRLRRSMTDLDAYLGLRSAVRAHDIGASLGTALRPGLWRAVASLSLSSISRRAGPRRRPDQAPAKLARAG